MCLTAFKFRTREYQIYSKASPFVILQNNELLKFCNLVNLVSVNLRVKSRIVTVTGPRGTLKRDFRHMAVDIMKTGPKTLKVEKWFGIKKELAAVRTVCSHIENMMKGVTRVRSTSPYIIAILRTGDKHFLKISGLQVQDEVGVRSFPHQHCHRQGLQERRGAKLLGREVHPQSGHAAGCDVQDVNGTER